MTDLEIQHAIDAIDDAEDVHDTDLVILRVIRFVFIVLPVSIAMAVYGFSTPVDDMKGSVLGFAGLGCSLLLLLIGVPFWVFARDEFRMARKKLRDAQRKLRDLQLEAADVCADQGQLLHGAQQLPTINSELNVPGPDWWSK